MATEKQKPLKFRPERPIVLSTENTGFRTQDEVIEAVEKLRGLNWLCCVGDKIRPFHMSFNDEKEFQEFKKDCSTLNIKIKSPVIKPDDIEEMEAEDSRGQVVPGADAKESYEDPAGKIHISGR